MAGVLSWYLQASWRHGAERACCVTALLVFSGVCDMHTRNLMHVCMHMPPAHKHMYVLARLHAHAFCVHDCMHMQVHGCAHALHSCAHAHIHVRTKQLRACSPSTHANTSTLYIAHYCLLTQLHHLRHVSPTVPAAHRWIVSPLGYKCLGVNISC